MTPKIVPKAVPDLVSLSEKKPLMYVVYSRIFPASNEGTLENVSLLSGEKSQSRRMYWKDITKFYRARMLSFHRLSILERAADNKCKIIAACQKSFKCGRVFQVQRSPIFYERRRNKALFTYTHDYPLPSPPPPHSTPLLPWVILPPPPTPCSCHPKTLRSGSCALAEASPLKRVTYLNVTKECHIWMDHDCGKPRRSIWAGNWLSVSPVKHKNIDLNS